MSVTANQGEDEPGVDPSSTPNANSNGPASAAAAAETAALDSQLCATDFPLRLCRVNFEGTLWPALKFTSVQELQLAVERDVELPDEARSGIQLKILQKGRSGDSGIAYLFGRGKIRRSLATLASDEMVVSYYSSNVDYPDDAGFQAAEAVVEKRVHELDSDDETVEDGELPSDPVTVEAEEGVRCRRREEITLQIHKPEQDDRLAKPRKSPTIATAVDGLAAEATTSVPTVEEVVPGGNGHEETILQIRKPEQDDLLTKGRESPTSTAAVDGPAAEATMDVLAVGEATPEGDGVGATSSGADTFDKPLINLENLPRMAAGIMGNDPSVQTECTTQIRRLLSVEKNAPIQQAVDSGVVPRFIEFLRRDENPALQFEAAWALTNIVSGATDHAEMVVEAGALAFFVPLLLNPHDNVREQAVWALGVIAGHSPTLRDLVLQAGGMPPLLQIIRLGPKLSMLRNATSSLMNFCRGKPKPDFDIVRHSLATLIQLISNPDEEILVDACWALSYLSDGPEENIQAVIDAGACSRLVVLLLGPPPAVQAPTLQTVGNIVTGNDLQTQSVLDNGALPVLLSLFTRPERKIRERVCWIISNILAGNKDQIQAVIDSNIVPPLIESLANAESDVRREAAWAIRNATNGGSPQQISFFVEQGCIGPMCDLLTLKDDQIITAILNGLENIGTDQVSVIAGSLEAKDCSKVEALKQHPNTDVSERCVQILKMFSEIDEE